MRDVGTGSRSRLRDVQTSELKQKILNSLRLRAELAKGGSFMNYYMAFGGTSLARQVGGPNIITSYDYDVQINEYGFRAEPKFSLTAALHQLFNASACCLCTMNATDRPSVAMACARSPCTARQLCHA